MCMALVVTLVLLLVSELVFGLTGAFLDGGLKTQELVLRTSFDAGYFGAMPSAYVALRHTGIEWVGQASVTLLALYLLWQFRSASQQAAALTPAGWRRAVSGQ